MVWHLGEVQSFWNEIAAHRLQSPEEADAAVRPPDDALIAWFQDVSRRLSTTLADADPTEPVWTWAPQRDIGFVRRRQAQEAAVHRWDAEAATASPSPIEPVVAADGVDEFLEFMISDEEVADGTESVGLHATDVEADWLIRVSDARLEWTRAPASADVEVRAPASDLLLLVWRRIGPDDVEVVGDRTALARFLDRANLD